MRNTLLKRKDFYFEDEYKEYLERQKNTVEYWNEIDHLIGEALNEYRDDQESYSEYWD